MTSALKALNKKEASGKDMDSPDDSNEAYVLTPRTQQRYEQINKEFANVMHMGGRPGSGLDRVSPTPHLYLQLIGVASRPVSSHLHTSGATFFMSSFLLL